MAFQGKSALITGGASGLGKHLAAELHSQGTTLLIADISVDSGEEFVKELNDKRPNSAYFKKTDVTNWEEQVDLFKFGQQALKRIDYVFPNAGILESTYLAHTPSDAVAFVKPDLKTIDINLYGVLYTSTLAAQVFRTQPILDGFRGKIIVTASVAAFTAIAYMPLYSASKHALLGFVRSLAGQLGPENITVNAVCPNVTRSNLAGPEIFNAVQAQGFLTANETVTKAFISFLGDSTANGETAEVSLDKIYSRRALDPVDEATAANVAGLSEGHKAAYAPPATTVAE